MKCCIADMRFKEVINIKDGYRFGCVNDVEIETCSGRVIAIIIWGRIRFFGIFGREDDIRICWENIEVIGEDTILVCCDREKCRQPRKRRHFLEPFCSSK